MLTAPTNSSLADYCYTTVRDRLVMLDIEPGSPISEQELCQELGVGRTPLREALKRLSTDHLVQFFPRRGTFATAADFSELNSLTEMQTILEPAGARRAATHAGPSQREALREMSAHIGELMDSSPSARTLIEYDLAVHRAIYELIDNAYMRETLFRLDSLATRLWWSAIQKVPSAAEHIEGHRSLLEAVADAEPERAAELAAEHVTEFHQRLQEIVLGTGERPVSPA